MDLPILELGIRRSGGGPLPVQQPDRSKKILMNIESASGEPNIEFGKEAQFIKIKTIEKIGA